MLEKFSLILCSTHCKVFHPCSMSHKAVGAILSQLHRRLQTRLRPSSDPWSEGLRIMNPLVVCISICLCFCLYMCLYVFFYVFLWVLVWLWLAFHVYRCLCLCLYMFSCVFPCVCVSVCVVVGGVYVCVTVCMRMYLCVSACVHVQYWERHLGWHSEEEAYQSTCTI